MESVQRFLYGPTPQERVKQWQQKLRTESRGLERELRQLDAAQAKAKKELKQLASKSGQGGNARVLAKEIVRTNKQKTRLHTSIAQLNSIGMQLNHQLGAWSLWHCSVSRLRLMPVHVSYCQDYGPSAKVDRDYEDIQFAHQAARTAKDYAEYVG